MGTADTFAIILLQVSILIQLGLIARDIKQLKERK